MIISTTFFVFYIYLYFTSFIKYFESTWMQEINCNKNADKIQLKNTLLLRNFWLKGGRGGGFYIKIYIKIL